MSDPSPSISPPVIPDHELLGRIGQGSYGEVWLARNAMGTLRAVKVIRRASFGDSRPYEREFNGLKNFEPISRKHDGLVDILQVSRTDDAGHFYYVMELADNANASPPYAPVTLGETAEGRSPSAPRNAGEDPAPPAFDGYRPLTLESRIRDNGRLPVSECVAIGATLADALRYLHDQGLVHRDIKPSNIIFVGGKAKLADVGLVARSGDARTFVGTEGFVPPEGPGSVQADLYGLGKCLYEMAMGKDRLAFPSPPSRLNDFPQRGELLELNEVITRACEPEPARRYANAQAMLSDLQLLGQGESIRRKRLRQKQLRLAACIIALACFCGLGIMLSRTLHRSSQGELSKGSLNSGQRNGSSGGIPLEDSFDSGQLDAARWQVGHQDWGTDPTKGIRTYSVETVEGELVIKVQAQHEEGLTAGESAWVDLTRDLRDFGPCTLQLSLSGLSYGGGVAVAVTSGGDPTGPYDYSGARLVDTYDTPMWQTNRMALTAMQVVFVPDANSAVVWPDVNRLGEFRVVELQALPKWHLRFVSGAQTSAGHGPASAELRIQQFSISASTRQYAVIGSVVEEISDWPVAEAVITDATGRVVATSSPGGAFCLAERPQGPLTVTRNGFEPARVEIGPGARGRSLLVRLARSARERGGVVASVPYGELRITAIGLWQNELWAAASYDLEDHRLFRVFQGRPLMDASRRSVPVYTQLVSFAECKGRLLGLTHWQGTLHDLTAESPRALLSLKSPIDSEPINWPRGCAFDGEHLWFIENDAEKTRWFVHALDIEAVKITKSLQTKDQGIRGLAWDGARFWVSSLERGLYAVDRDVALRLGTLESGAVAGPFPGSYERLVFVGNSLWGLDEKSRLLCKIQTGD